MEVRVGSYVDGTPRLQTFNWSSCKIAHMREDAKEVPRPKLGRPKKKPSPTETTSGSSENSSSSPPSVSTPSADMSLPETTSKTPHPDYIKKGPLITEEMFDNANWPKILQIPSRGRPIRSTRNPNPSYVDAVSYWPALSSKGISLGVQ